MHSATIFNHTTRSRQCDDHNNHRWTRIEIREGTITFGWPRSSVVEIDEEANKVVIHDVDEPLTIDSNIQLLQLSECCFMYDIKTQMYPKEDQESPTNVPLSSHDIPKLLKEVVQLRQENEDLKHKVNSLHWGNDKHQMGSG